MCCYVMLSVSVYQHAVTLAITISLIATTYIRGWCDFVLLCGQLESVVQFRVLGTAKGDEPCLKGRCRTGEF